MSTLATREEINHCQFHEWYDKFEKNTIKSRIVPLPKEFIDYLKEDNIMIPDTLATDPNSTEDEEEIDDVCQRFSELNNKIKSSMDELKNEVFIKTNWSCPKDVSWMIGGSLKCFNLRDIYLLLKSSDRVMYDFESIYEHCEDKTVVTEHYLILRRWCNLNPSMEFRLFVYDEELVAVCQRDCTVHYEFLKLERQRLESEIEEFFYENLQNKYSLRNYTVDVYIDKKNRIWIVDFNPFGAPTSSLMFSWEELIDSERDSTGSILKVVESEAEVLADASGSYRGPVDVHLSPNFPNFLEICKQQAQEEDN